MNTLKQHRKAMKLDQHALARETGVSQSRICTIERYGDLPSPRQAKILADYFGLKLEALFPDGTQEKRCSRWMPDIYMPPEPHPTPVPHYPKRFRIACRKCGSWIYLQTDDYHPITDNGDLACPACGAGFDVAEVGI